MNIEKTFTDDHQVNLKVTIDDARLDEAKQRAARKLAKRTSIPGFRPGKAPYHVIARTVGDAAILQEAVDLILDEDYSKIIDEAGINPYSSGALNNIPSMEPLTLEFTVPLEAETTLGDYKSVRFPYDLEPVSDENVTAYLEDLRERMAFPRTLLARLPRLKLITIIGRITNLDVAAARYGKGRVVAFGHGGYFSRGALETGDTAALVRNAILWSGGERAEPRVAVVGLGAIRQQFEGSDGLAPIALPDRDWKRALTEADVICLGDVGSRLRNLVNRLERVSAFKIPMLMTSGFGI